MCASLYTPRSPTEEPNGSQAESSEQFCEACRHKDLRPATGRSGVVYAEYRKSSTALWALSWGSGFTVFWHYWWLLSALAKCRGNRSAASTAGGWKKLRCFQKWRGRLRWWRLKLWPAALPSIARRKNEPSAYQNDMLLVRLNWSVICLEQCREQRSSDKVPGQSPDTWLSRCPTSKIRCCFHSHIFALGVLDAPNVVVRNDRDLLVEVIVMAPVNAPLYMLRHSKSNTTVFEITRLQNAAGQCNIACSPYTSWLLVTLPPSYNKMKNTTCNFSKNVLQKMYLLSIDPRLPHRISTGMKFCYICMVSQISPHWMHSGTMFIHIPWWESLSKTPSN